MAEEQDASDPRRRQTRDYTTSTSMPGSPNSLDGFATATTITSQQQLRQENNNNSQTRKPIEHEQPPQLDDDDGLTTDSDSDDEDYTRTRSNLSNAAPNPLPTKPKKQGKLAATFTKLGIDAPTVIMMFKYVLYMHILFI